MDIPVKVGQVFCSDVFYGDSDAVRNACRKFDILGLEMESAGLYWTAQSLHKQALAILTVSDHVFTGESLPADERQKSFHDMMKLALETACHFT